ncbi:MAG: tRNA (adenosine(37)-N6)-threonylcarbamoyltransferase complex ATPase subunit type 1 TsaE [Planctomycetaceae bacterium]|nr:tRNA (adenosine(37)-N6)-threonylcarbamoyltransferase complex ATPase subunit type 1 TsaE [Planctomycetaceae bacterium]
MVEYTATSSSLADTRTIGRRIGELLQPGDVIALIGPLGAGKTHFVQAIGESFGIAREEINSPTFVLIQEYDGRVPICHIDAYRLADVDEFLELGADELLGGDAICLIEWADRVADVLPKDQIIVEIRVIDETSRQFQVRAESGRGLELVNQLASPL